MSPNELELTVTERADGAKHIAVVGEMDSASAPALGVAIDRLLDEGIGRVVLDLSQVPFADSGALGVLIAAGFRLESAGGKLVIGTSSDEVKRLLEITGLSARYSAP